MADNVHITRINDTVANISSNLDPNQIAVSTDVTTWGFRAFAWRDAGSDLHWAAAMNENAEFDDVTVGGDLFVDEYIKLTGGTTNSIRLRSDSISMYADAVQVADFTSDNTTILAGDFGVGIVPTYKLDVFGESAATAAVVDVQRVTAASTGESAAGFGVGLLLQAENQYGSIFNVGRVYSKYIYNGLTGSATSVTGIQYRDKSETLIDGLNVSVNGLRTGEAIIATGTHGSGWIEDGIGAGTRLMWYPRKSAFRAGYVSG